MNEHNEKTWVWVLESMPNGSQHWEREALVSEHEVDQAVARLKIEFPGHKIKVGDRKPRPVRRTKA